MDNSKHSGNNSDGSYIYIQEELQRAPSTNDPDHDSDDEDEEDDNNNPGKQLVQKPKSLRDFLAIADVCWHQYRLKDLILVFLLLAYVVVAAMVMVILEGGAQTENRLLYQKTVQDFWHHFAGNLTLNLLNTSDLAVFADSDISAKFDKKVRHELLRYHEGLMAIYATKDGPYLEWDFWNATLFGLSLFTTIGYKHLYPVTRGGKIATMLLATFGIPLLLTVIQRLALLMYDAVTFILNSIVHFCKRKWATTMFKKDGRHHLLKQRWAPSREVTLTLPFSVGVFLLMSWIFACPSTILLWETEWTYLDAFYYFFLSFTTVGLNYGAPAQHRYLYLVWLWAIIGLSLLSLCFKILYSPIDRQLQSPLEHFEHVGGHKSASMAAQTDSACIPSDWCVSTMSLASSRLIERSLGPSQLAKVGTPRLPRKLLQTRMLPQMAREEENKRGRPHPPGRLHFANGSCDLIYDRGSGAFLATEEDAGSPFKSRDDLSEMSEEYKKELRWLSKLGRYSETQSLNEMTMTDAVDESRFIMASLQQRNAESQSLGQVRLAVPVGDATSSKATPTTTTICGTSTGCL